MTRVLGVLGLLLALAACAGRPPAAPGDVAGLVIDSRVIPGGGAVEVQADHRSFDHRVEAVALVAPDGTVHPAVEYERETVRYELGPSGAVGVGGGGFGSGGSSVGAGISLGFPLTGGEALYRTNALIPIPDPDEYAGFSEAWTVRVVVEARSGARRTVDRPAPRAY